MEAPCFCRSREAQIPRVATPGANTPCKFTERFCSSLPVLLLVLVLKTGSILWAELTRQFVDRRWYVSTFHTPKPCRKESLVGPRRL